MARESSRRFTTIEGWKDVGQGIYTAAGAGMQILAVDPDFDLESYGVRQHFRERVPKSSIISPHTSTFRRSAETGHTSDQEAESEQVEPPYHVFPTKRKWLLVWIIGVAGLFSGLSSNIYFPSLDVIAQDLRVTLAAVSLTITSYLIIQGVSPLIWGSFSDVVGRRPIYIYSFLVYIIANIVLSLSPNFPVLLVFRGLQAAGSASTVSIGNGVIQDICPPSERGGFISFYQAIRNFSIAIGPVLGGILAKLFGFRSIFVFLLISSAVTLGVIIFLLPETMRSIAGNGSLRLKGIYVPLIWRISKEPSYLVDADENIDRAKVNFGTFVFPLKLLGNMSILMTLVPGGIVYAIWSMVTSSTTGLFKDRFHLNEILLGLAFLPNGLGTIIGSTIAGKLMNRDFVLTVVEYKLWHGLPETYKLAQKDLPTNFPIERARLRSMWWIMALFIISTSLYGWSLADRAFATKPGAIALPLSLQFFIAATSNAVFAINQTLVSDLCPGKGASSTAINNLVRCTLGAIGVAFIDQMIASLGVGPSFMGLALISFVCVPFLIIEQNWGTSWRQQGSETDEKERNAKM